MLSSNVIPIDVYSAQQKGHVGRRMTTQRWGSRLPRRLGSTSHHHVNRNANEHHHETNGSSRSISKENNQQDRQRWNETPKRKIESSRRLTRKKLTQDRMKHRQCKRECCGTSNTSETLWLQLSSHSVVMTEYLVVVNADIASSLSFSNVTRSFNLRKGSEMLTSKSIIHL